jgi:hypothetical protein
MLTVLERLHTAINQHDLEAMLECFDPEYRSEHHSTRTGASVARSRSERTGRGC